MSSCRELIVAVALLGAFGAAQAQGQGRAQDGAYPGIGRAATAKELAAWDIDVRPDFKGLPKGSGSVAKGQEVWDAKCASCHGVFGESNEVFSPLVGGTGAEDIKTGRVAKLTDAGYPGRTTLMKAATVSTLWDYINRAMPWTQPKSLSVEEVYGVTAYLLNMGGVVADDFVLSNDNIGEVQQRMPNRNGMTREHAMWPGATMGNRKPDVQAVACMKDCGPAPEVASSIPDFARDAHGNLAEQNRLVGAQRGADTRKSKGKGKDGKEAAAGDGAATRVAQAAPADKAAKPAAPAAPASATAAAAAKPAAADGASAGSFAQAQQNGCVACHGLENKLVGPSFRDIAGKYTGRADAVAYLAGKIKAGSSGVWGPVPMPPQSLPEADAKAIAQWLAAGAKK